MLLPLKIMILVTDGDRRKRFGQRLYEHMVNTTFEGATGAVRYNQGEDVVSAEGELSRRRWRGDRAGLGSYRILHYRVDDSLELDDVGNWTAAGAHVAITDSITWATRDGKQPQSRMCGVDGANFGLKLMNFALNVMNSVLKMMNSVLKMSNFALKGRSAHTGSVTRARSATLTPAAALNSPYTTASQRSPLTRPTSRPSSRKCFQRWGTDSGRQARRPQYARFTFLRRAMCAVGRMTRLPLIGSSRRFRTTSGSLGSATTASRI